MGRAGVLTEAGRWSEANARKCANTMIHTTNCPYLHRIAHFYGELNLNTWWYMNKIGHHRNITVCHDLVWTAFNDFTEISSQKWLIAWKGLKRELIKVPRNKPELIGQSMAVELLPYMLYEVGGGWGGTNYNQLNCSPQRHDPLGLFTGKSTVNIWIAFIQSTHT